jgi:hypothetical protein
VQNKFRDRVRNYKLCPSLGPANLANKGVNIVQA